MSKTTLAFVFLTGAGQAAPATWLAGNNSQLLQVGAVVGGWGATGIPENVCRGSIGGGVHPGRLLSGTAWNGSQFVPFSSCQIGYGGQEMSLSSYEYLVETWQAVTDRNAPLPAGAVVMGHDSQQADGSLPPLYVCRSHDSTGVRPGKTRPGFGGCNVAENGREVTVPTYDLLISTFPFTQAPVTSTQPRPNDVLIGGSGVTGGNLYLCAAQLNGGVHPGALDVNGVCHFGWGGAEQTATASTGYTALVPRWINISPGSTFPTGNEADGSLLYSCRAEYPAGSGAVVAGKFHKGWAGCHIGLNGQEIEVTSTWYSFDIPVFLVPPH